MPVPPRPRPRHRRQAPGPILIAIAAGAAVVGLGYASVAQAHSRGIATDSCDGCHGNAAMSTLTLTPDKTPFNPGDTVTFTLTVKWASLKSAGAFIYASEVGTLKAISGEGLAVSGTALLQTAAKAGSNGQVTFRFGWQAPSKAGGVSFLVAAVGANGNGSSSGDAPGRGEFQWAFGCEGRTFFRDSDADGYGTRAYGTALGCPDTTPPMGYAAAEGDCDENDQRVNPGAAEICNLKDDNCDGRIDENAPPTELWPDNDGDGFFQYQTGTSKMGCGAVKGYAAVPGDCNDNDATINPRAQEICNLKDDNCDGRVDERLRPTCGVGQCARASNTCDAAACVPGAPQVEICNLLDDDCDGEVDENTCAAGMVCLLSGCAPEGSGAGAGGSGGGIGSGGTGGRTSGSGGTGTVPPTGAGGATGAAGAIPPGADAPGGCGVAGAGTSPAAAGSVLALVLALVLRFLLGLPALRPASSRRKRPARDVP